MLLLKRLAAVTNPVAEFLWPPVSGWTSTGTNELPLHGAGRPFCRAFRCYLTAGRNMGWMVGMLRAVM